MAGRHAMTRETALETLNSPAGRGLAAAMAVGTMLGVAIPTASADVTENREGSRGTARLASVAPEATTEVTVDADASWEIAQVAVQAEDSDSSLALDMEVTAPVVEEEVTVEETTTTAVADTDTATAAVVSEEAPAATSSNSGLRSQIVAYARQFSGVPYVTGGTTPSGWDCSGFVNYVFGSFGISMPRTSSAIAASFTQVPASQAQPGDLVYWPGHIGIYTGNGMHIAAANPSTGTYEHAVYGSPIYPRVVG